MAYTGGKGKKRRLKRSAAACASCGIRLHAVPNASVIAVRRMPRSKRVPNRPYGGNLCVRCMREAFKSKVV